MSYTALGDTVNVASRLEGLNKQFFSHFACSQDVLCDSFLMKCFVVRYLGAVLPKGKILPLPMFEVLGVTNPKLHDALEATAPTSAEDSIQVMEAVGSPTVADFNRTTAALDGAASPIRTDPDGRMASFVEQKRKTTRPIEECYNGVGRVVRLPQWSRARRGVVLQRCVHLLEAKDNGRGLDLLCMAESILQDDTEGEQLAARYDGVLKDIATRRDGIRCWQNAKLLGEKMSKRKSSRDLLKSKAAAPLLTSICHSTDSAISPEDARRNSENP